MNVCLKQKSYFNYTSPVSKTISVALQIIPDIYLQGELQELTFFQKPVLCEKKY